MKFILPIAKTLSLLLVSQSLVAAVAPAALNRIAAKINDKIITTNQVTQQTSIERQQLISQHARVPAENILKTAVLNNMINQAVLLQAAERANISVTNSETTAVLDNIANSQHVTPQQILDEQHQHGLSSQNFLAQLKNQIVVQKLQRDYVQSTINISQAEIDTYVRSTNSQNSDLVYHIEEIALALPATATPTQIKKIKQYANTVRAKAKANISFSTLASTLPKGPTVLHSKDLGWRSLAALPAAFASVVQSMQAGDISQPILANDSLHILSLTGVRSNTNVSAKRDEVADALLKRRFNERFNIWLQQLRHSAYIEITPS